MAKVETIKRSTYGIGHTKFYTKSVVADYLVDVTSDGVTKVNNDVHLLLRQKTLHRKIGIEALRDYIDTLRVQQSDVPNFTDDELFQLIEPKSVNNLTTAYEYAKYLQEHQTDVKRRYDDMKARKAEFEERKAFYDSLKPNKY